MVRERIPMYIVLEVLRQRYQENVTSVRKIAQSVDISRPTAQKYLDLAEAIGIGYWPLREETGDLARLRSALFPDKKESANPGTTLPDWQEVEKELKQRKKSGVTRRLLWEEYRVSLPKGLSYSQYCALYSKYLKNGDLRLHVPHAPGEELYVDYSGPKIRIEPPGQPPYFASLFVAVMGRSSYAFACVTTNMKPPPGSTPTERPSNTWEVCRVWLFPTGPGQRLYPRTGSNRISIGRFGRWPHIMGSRSPRPARILLGIKGP